MVFQQQQTMTTAAEFPASNGTSTSDRPKNGLHPDPLANFLVEPARKEHLAEINEFLFTDFLTTEPLNASVGLTKEESVDFFNYLVESSFHDGISYLVRDPAAKNRLVAVRLAFISRRNGHQHNGNGQEATAVVDPFAKGYPEGGNVAKICAILHAVESKIWQLVPAEIDTLASWLILSVHSDYKRRGIAGALLEHRLDKFRALGCQGIVTEASARNSQNLFKKLGYQRIFELLHADWIGADGKPVFKCLDGTDRVTLEFKPLPTAKST